VLLTDLLRQAPPDATIVSGDERLTYAGLLRRVERRAAGLHDWGVRARDRVALHRRNGVEWVEVWFAAAWLDADLVPLDTGLGDDEVRAVLERSGARWLLWSPSEPAEHPARVHLLVRGLALTSTQELPYADEPLPAAETERAAWVRPDGSAVPHADLVRDARAWVVDGTALVADPLPGRGARALLAAMAHGADVVLA
jgi:fatty-acyl-CoA synthase